MQQTRLLEPDELRRLIEAGIPGAAVTVTDLTGTRDHYRVDVAASAFAGKTLVQQHQMVYRAVGGHLTQGVHALQVKTRVPQESAS